MSKIAGEEPQPEAELGSRPRHPPRPEDELIRARQRERARIMAWLLGGLVLLLFLITLVKVGGGK